MAASKPLTDDMIDELPDDDPLEGFDLLEAYGIDAEGVETTADAQKKLREYLKQHVSGFHEKNLFLTRARDI